MPFLPQPQCGPAKNPRQRPLAIPAGGQSNRYSSLSRSDPGAAPFLHSAEDGQQSPYQRRRHRPKAERAVEQPGSEAGPSDAEAGSGTGTGAGLGLGSGRDGGTASSAVEAERKKAWWTVSFSSRTAGEPGTVAEHAHSQQSALTQALLGRSEAPQGAQAGGSASTSTSSGPLTSDTARSTVSASKRKINFVLGSVSAEPSAGQGEAQSGSRRIPAAPVDGKSSDALQGAAQPQALPGLAEKPAEPKGILKKGSEPYVPDPPVAAARPRQLHPGHTEDCPSLHGGFRIRMLLERKRSFLREAHQQSSMAWPMMISTFLQLLMTMISLAFVGRLGETALAAASIATAFANVVGHIVLQGLASSLETLCGQAHGAGAHSLLGIYLQRGLLCLSLMALPLAWAWWNAGAVLVFFHQDPAIAALAGLYLRYLLPSLAANVVMQCLERFLQAQGVTFPMALCATGAFILHIPLTWALVFHFGLGLVGAPMAVSLSFLANLAMLLLYTTLSGVAHESWDGFTMQAFYGWDEFLALAVPSTAMICLEYWGMELLTLLAGLLPNPSLEVSTLSILLSIGNLAFVFPYGIGAAVSIRVSNELGAENPYKAVDAARVGVIFGLLEVSLLDMLLFLVRKDWGWAFTSSAPVAEYVAQLVPISLVAIYCDAMLAVLSGIVRGCGYQHLAVVANLGAYYLVGLPLAAFLGFYCDLRARGLYLGLVTGMVTQALSLLVIVLRTSWIDASESAKERLEEALLFQEEWEKEYEDSDEEEDDEDEEEEAPGSAKRPELGAGQDPAHVVIQC